MKYYLWLFGMLCFFQIALYGQSTYVLDGEVLDEKGEPLDGALVIVNPVGKAIVTDDHGVFHLSGLSKATYDLHVSFLGFQDFHQHLVLHASQKVTIKMTRALMTLDEVVVSDSYADQRKKEASLGVEVVTDDFLKRNQGGSLMKSLDRLAGVSSMDIGSGHSKPVIRGMGFNRVVVVENGIKHEGQQWGADHGLEIDQYAVDRVEVIKGPASLKYGSDAIGGVIDVAQVAYPESNYFGGSVELTGKSNNNLMGTSVSLEGRRNNLFATARATILDYGDYKVPTDSVDIYSYRAPLYQNHLRNTAGYEHNFHVSLGLIKSHFLGRLFVSNVSSKSGFFANAHGLEPRNVNEALHDASDRDIQYPYQQVDHLKIINKNEWEWDAFEVKTDLGFQRNFRQEWSMYVSHGYMPAVYEGDEGFAPELERQFDKYVYSANAEASYFKSEQVTFTAGLSGVYQDNRISGRGFIIPAFRQLNVGGFLVGKLKMTERSLFQLGVRYDYGHVIIDHFNDWFTSPVITGSDTTYQYLQRASDTERDFSNTSWSLGYNYNSKHWSVKANIGKSFRMPIAKELGANGVNYHRFSYEVGDANLSPEVAYQLDLGVEAKSEKFAIGISPFVNYFTNYIYLNPTSEHDRLYGNGNQVFYYSESKVFRYGGEMHAHYELITDLNVGVIGEYVFSQQLSGQKKGYTLPFSPPSSFIFNVRYQKRKWLGLVNPYASTDLKLVSAQTRIVPPEVVTEGYQVVNLRLGAEVKLKERNLAWSLQIQNLFNTKYFNHTSFYRLINVPEAGRNVILNVSVPFQVKKQSNE